MPKKYLGQHFLKDVSIAKRIIKYGKIDGDIVLEIGPGKGILTRELVKKGEVIAIEKDGDLFEELKDIDAKFIFGDALKVRWPKFDKIIANLPYNISSPIIFKMFEHKWKLAVLMVQKEFADRFVAKPGSKNYSRLTVAVNYYCKPKILEKVSKVKFYPKPKVESVIIRLTPKTPEFKIDKKFWNFIRELFRHKKKIVKAALKVSKFKKFDLPEKLGNKRVVSCELKDLKEIYDYYEKI